MLFSFCAFTPKKEKKIKSDLIFVGKALPWRQWRSGWLGVRAVRAPGERGHRPEAWDGAEDEGDGGAVEEGEGGGHPSLPAGEEEVRGPDWKFTEAGQRHKTFFPFI